MPMSMVYATMKGRLVQENRGGVVTRYVADTLGSVIQTRDVAGNQMSSTTYWPYGEVRTQTGANPSPWGFVGTLGYYKDTAARLYVRARMLRADLGRWLSVDPFWPRQRGYAYARSNPTTWVDPTGLIPIQLAAAILGCIVNAGLSIWDVLRGGGGLGEALCKGALSCLTGAITGFILTLLPAGAWGLGCITGAVGSIVGALLGKLCEPPPRCFKPNEGLCTAIAAGISGLLGCFGGGGGNEVADFLIGFIAGVSGLSCQNVIGAISPR